MRQEPASMRLAGGMGALVSALVARLPQTQLHAKARVMQLTMAEDRVVLTLDGTDGAARPVEAAQVLLALPPRLLAETIGFDPALAPETLARWRDTATWMAPHAKIFALYDRPFWRERGLSGTAQSHVGPLVEIHDARTASGGAALFGSVGLGADQRAAVREQALVAAAVAQFARLFGPEAATPRATLFKDWTADPMTATTADRVPGGHPIPSNLPWLTGKWADRAVLGGSETSARDPGYLAGAIDAGGRAARLLIDRLKTSATKETIAC
jgi:monoamine oxidase